MPQRTETFGPLVVAYDDEGTLRPRPWTLLQSGWAVELLPDLAPGPVLELCSGVGHIGQAVAVATGRGLVQVDVDPDACALARANADTNGLGASVEVRCGDLRTQVHAAERYALVLADPPYLPSDEAEAEEQDPDLAVDGGPDGLDLTRRCLAVAGSAVDASGAVLLQTLGPEAVGRLGPDLEAAGLRLVDVRTHDERRAVALLRPLRSPLCPA